jgi:hypothetical protein
VAVTLAPHLQFFSGQRPWRSLPLQHANTRTRLSIRATVRRAAPPAAAAPVRTLLQHCPHAPLNLPQTSPFPRASTAAAAPGTRHPATGSACGPELFSRRTPRRVRRSPSHRITSCPSRASPVSHCKLASGSSAAPAPAPSPSHHRCRRTGSCRRLARNCGGCQLVSASRSTSTSISISLGLFRNLPLHGLITL